jgi:dihydroorotase
VRISAETCPHYLALTNAEFETLGVAMKAYPPVRTPSDQAALWAAILDGTIQSIGSDHAPHARAEKEQPIGLAPAGISGVETMASVLIDQMLGGRLTPERLAYVLSEGTARLYRLYPKKGAIEPRADADFTLVDPASTTSVDTARLHSKEPYSPWAGRTLRGRIAATVLRGELVARDGEPVGAPRGRQVRPLAGAAAGAQ